MTIFDKNVLELICKDTNKKFACFKSSYTNDKSKDCYL